jgi:hypothetical protein
MEPPGTNWKHEGKPHHPLRVKSVAQVPEIKVSGCREKPVPLGKFLARSQFPELRNWLTGPMSPRDLGLFPFWLSFR